jgi:hypothetical protein
VRAARVGLRGQDCGQPVRDVEHAVAESPVPIRSGHLHFVAADELPSALLVIDLREARQEALLISVGFGVLPTGFELRRFGRLPWRCRTIADSQDRRNLPHRRQSLRRAERAFPTRGVEGQMKRPDRLHRQDPIRHAGIVFGDRPHLRLVSRVVQDQSA